VRPPSKAPIVYIEKGQSKVTPIETADWARAATKYIEAKSIKAAVDTLLKECESQLAGLLGDNNTDAGEGAGLRCYYKMEEGRKTLDTIALIADYPELKLEDYKKQSPAAMRFRSYIIKPKKGA
jgi:hypothetical protein